jgi:hypothetical protein
VLAGREVLVGRELVLLVQEKVMERMVMLMGRKLVLLVQEKVGSQHGVVGFVGEEKHAGPGCSDYAAPATPQTRC